MTNSNVPEKVHVMDAPKSVTTVVAGTVVTVAISIMGALTAMGVDTTEFRGVLNAILNFGGLALGVVSAIYAGTAAKTGKETAQRMNGGLDKRIQEAVLTALEGRDHGRQAL